MTIGLTSKKLTRRRLLQTGSAGAAAILGGALIGCGGDEDGDEDEASSGDVEEIKRGGTLRIGATYDLLSLEPHIIYANHRDTLWPVYDALTKYDGKFQPQPQLATSWEQTDGGATLVIKLREGVTFHSGREFTSEDVKWNLTRVKDPNLPFSQFRVMATWFPNIETPDKNTIVLKSEKPRPAVFDFFELFLIADSATKSGSDAATTAIGTGPWKFVEWRQGVHFKLAKNPVYWDKDVPYLDEITWSLPLEQETVVAQFEAGAIDAIDNPPINGFDRYRNDDRFQALIHPSPGAYYTMGFNNGIEPFNDKRVRQAFNWAIDRQRFTSLILKGIVEPFSLPWPKASLAYDEAKARHYSLDLKKAADLLRAANAEGLQTTAITAPSRPEVVDFAPIWQNDLKSIGVEMEIRVLESPAFTEAQNSRNYNAVYAGGASYAGLGSPGSMFSISPNVWGGDGKNTTGFENARWRELLEQVSSEIDANKQKQIYGQLNDMILDESQIAVTAPQAWRLALAKKVKGVTNDMKDSWDYTRASLT